jgi:hypothetical protein
MFIDPILLLWSQSLDAKLLGNHFQKQVNDVVLDFIPCHPEVWRPVLQSIIGALLKLINSNSNSTSESTYSPMFIDLILLL